ncbi:aconitase X [Sapientia aquatica]|uniref:DUF521 domain-containing protein n=1 Tax=Sapientia aquatica TaxID=1549640 RepID=A0A4R5VQE5_9BURK|nr:aconitase X [Sapientia aquatica]TDK60460.1 DUF521 domain-containing protein [Sapientia aquatica]
MNYLEWAENLQAKVAIAMNVQSYVPVSRAHLVGCYHSGPANLDLIRQLANSGARVAIPTTMNASAADMIEGKQGRCPRATDYDQNYELVSLLEQIGCQPTLTCAPYYLPDPPKLGENIAWAESNAVVFANSVLGARTNMTMQYLDLSAALTGRIPAFGRYADANRIPALRFDVAEIPEVWFQSDAFFQLLGSILGSECKTGVPIITGGPAEIDTDHLRSIGAAAASAGNLDLFHWEGVTAESRNGLLDCHLNQLPVRKISKAMITDALSKLNRDAHFIPDTLCMGTPHASLNELHKLENYIQNRKLPPNKRIIVSLGRYVHEAASHAGLISRMEALGVEFIRDTCTYYGNLIGETGGGIVTPSFKWAYYGGSQLGKPVAFARIDRAIELLFSGVEIGTDPFWN